MVHTTVAAATSGQPICFNASVTHTGVGPVADVVVLAFVSSNHDDATPNPRLCDFAREAAIAPHETRQLVLCVDALGSALALVDDNGTARVVPGNYTVTVGVAGGVGGDGAGSAVGTAVVVP